MRAQVRFGQDRNSLKGVKIMDAIRMQADSLPAVAIERHGFVSMQQNRLQRQELPVSNGLWGVILGALKLAVISQVGAPLPPCPERPKKLTNYRCAQIHSSFLGRVADETRTRHRLVSVFHPYFIRGYLAFLFDATARDDEKSAVPKPAITKQIVTEIAFKQQEKDRETDGGGHVVKKISPPFGMLPITTPNTPQVQPKTEKNEQEGNGSQRSGFPKQLAE